MNPTQGTRALIYRVVAAVLAVLLVYGFVSDAEAAAWLEFSESVVALAAVVLAARNTPRGKDGSTGRP